MINKFTLRELEKVRDLLPEELDENTNHFIIPCSNGNVINIGDRLTIKIENYIINEPPNFDLSERWNRGTFPPEEILDVEIYTIKGKMIGVKSVGKFTQIYWEGWLPSKGITVL